MRVRFPRIAFLIACAVSLALPLAAQSPNGTINGRVVDPSNGVIVGADILVINDVTGVKYSGKTNDDGIYVVPNLPPGPYRLQVSKAGFKTLIKPDIVLNVQDALSINFTLPIGAVFETVTVEGGAPLVNTESAAVSTVVDQQYVGNMPLNGRSLQNLILLTPGVVTNTPQSGAGGEFSVNGQRTESNNYTVDGVSANVSINPTSAAQPAGPSGSLPVATALGTTQGLVSLDALEEFRVESSTYSAEYGRSPGGQFSFVTRSGTNLWHGTAFDYLRNNVFDANDWFNNYYGESEPPLRQNDFGGTLGGPVEIPGFYDGKDKTFFYFSFEGLRLDQPQAATLTNVPDASLRSGTPAPLQQVLNAFPLPNGIDLGNGLAEFIGTWSNPSTIDSTSVRADHVISGKLRLFFRFSNTSSEVVTRDTGVASMLDHSGYQTRTYTLGATSLISSTTSDEFRLNYSSNEGTLASTLSNFGGATPVNLAELQGFGNAAKPAPYIGVGLYLGGTYPQLIQDGYSGKQKQWNIVDTLTLSRGRHQVKLGVDFRKLEPSIFESSPTAIYLYLSTSSIEANSVDLGVGESFSPAFPVYTNFSAFAQDEWRLTPRLTLSMGLRWEVNPAPGARKGNLPYTIQGSINDLSTLTLAPEGTPLWQTTWFNLAPRLGAAYILRNTPNLETVVRGGGGVFFDTGQQLGSYGYGGPGFSAINFFAGAFPAPLVDVSPTIINPPVAPYTSTTAAGFPAHLQLPFTLQWNASIQQAFGKSQSLTVSYVGANGRRLLEQEQINAGSINPNFGTIVYTRNGLTSDYNALQVQYQRRLTQGLQALASYTWSHAIDYGSFNFVIPYERGNSDLDVRHNFTGAFMYDLPYGFGNKLARNAFHHWGLDGRFTVRTAFPVPLSGVHVIDPANGQTYSSGLNLVPGQPVYIYGSECASVSGSGLTCPGNRAINPNAFSLPIGCTPSSCPPGTGVGDAPRNFVRGFGAWQMDLAVRREFPIYERLKVQFRAEAFNILNHPNFGTITSTYCSAGPGCTFGQASATLANSLVGLSPLYQTGGPRSIQLALKLTF